MPQIGEYVISVCSSALVCCLITPFLKKKSVGKILPGLFLLLTVLQPLVDIQIPSIENLTQQFQFEAQQAVMTGEETTRDEIGKIIKQRTAAYILQKADALGLQLSVEVGISDSPLPTPDRITIIGPAAPYAKQQMQELISRELGIAKENQIWTSASG